jgi:prepilin-type N-terminal cleavage/methylation domain-containing protein
MTRNSLRRYRSGLGRGYTAVEVLMAMTVMAIGAAAVMSMQKTTVLGNFEARETDIANSIARLWVERLRRDSMQWTSPGPITGTTSNVATALVVNAGLTNLNNWFLPNQYITATANIVQPLSPGFDILGRDLTQADLGKALFCVQVRLSALAPGASPDLLRADIRVLWPRGINNSAGGGACAVATNNYVDATLYHSLYVTTGLRGNPI